MTAGKRRPDSLRIPVMWGSREIARCEESQVGRRIVISTERIWDKKNARRLAKWLLRAADWMESK